MKVILLQAGESIGELDLSSDAYTIGRGDDCSIVVDDPSLAETHARLFEEDGTAYIEPVEAETQVNGAAISERTALTDSDQLSFGSIDLSVSIQAVPPPLSATTSEIDTSSISNKDAPNDKKAGTGIGKGLLGMAKASAREAGRGAKLAGLKAQIEKVRRIDLHNAHLALGRKACELGVMGDELSSEYAQVRDLETQIAEKRQGSSADGDAGVMAKAKAKAVSAKMHAEAELLERKRNGVLAQVGLRIAEDATDQAELTEELQAAATVSQRIDELQAAHDIATEDHSARNALASSAKSVGSGAAADVAAMRSSDQGKPIWKRKQVWVVAACVVLIILASALVLNQNHKDSTSSSLDAPRTHSVSAKRKSVDPEWYGYGYVVGEMMRSASRAFGTPAKEGDLGSWLSKRGERRRMSAADYAACSAGYWDALNGHSPKHQKRSTAP